MEEISSMNNDMAIMTGLAIDSSHQQDINVSHTQKNFLVENVNERSVNSEATGTTEVVSQQDTLDSVKNAVIELFQRVD